MEGDTEDSTVQRSKDREIDLRKKIGENVFKRRNCLINILKVILMLFLKNLS